ncbi:DUF2309 domain-containing protein [Holospora curviuscula]|uniref:Probable inorganic carbon transporter subunit DabA n=1 Tax=Holospora curviuscula TaxID=1082868 RepID=A0A2S5R914_9PROT|nr:DUF2309 domain-containing protein [Holospora curviuscula]PPE03692.1 hypothetical protein HCUR_00830 [Holospora curviuscula]
MIFPPNKQDQEIVINSEKIARINNALDLVKESWNVIAPFWPLKNLVAVNPLKGLEALPIEQAILEGGVLFQHNELPSPMASINRQTIKWLQAFFDEAQATIGMPLRTQGLYKAWKKLAYFDTQIHGGNVKKKQWLLELSNTPEVAVEECLLRLKIPKKDHGLFLTLILTTLPGWAAHIKYRTHWTKDNPSHPHSVSEIEYTAMRLIITNLLWERARDLLEWHKTLRKLHQKKISPMTAIHHAEADYLLPLLNMLSLQAGTYPSKQAISSDAQVIFCIDVRSEPFRRALEQTGNYETFGFSGFFGLPVRIQNTITEEIYSSCPVLLSPKYTVKEVSSCSSASCIQDHKHYQRLTILKTLYQSLKYNFTTSFAVVELLGFITAFWMTLKTLAPTFATKFYNFLIEKISPKAIITPVFESISFKDQCEDAESVLRTLGLTKNFSPVVVLCGHGSTTHNNAYATLLDCGACGGRHGGNNARILAKILNSEPVRHYLSEVGIAIPQSTYFMAAEHNTTRDEVEIYDTDTYNDSLKKTIQILKKDLKKAGEINSQIRCKSMNFHGNKDISTKHTQRRSTDWAQVRPEWGLAGNSSFIVAPRELTKNIDLKGRAFLHSYDYLQDPQGTFLGMILTAPMVVAQWINSQYLFSTLDNVAYGSGSKITHNVTGKIGIMQGNASDLMIGLPLQSVYKTDTEMYHTPVRLMTIIYAPWRLVDKIIETHTILQTLFRNGWVRVTCIDPDNTDHHYFLHRDLTWKREVE